jgi:hypothetical protein
MSEAKKVEFTSGPWPMQPVRRGDKEIFIDADGDGWNRLGCEVTRDDCDTETALANARLIVASPDGHELISRAVSDRIDEKWLEDAIAYLRKVKEGPQ